MSTNLIEMKCGEVPITLTNDTIFCNNKYQMDHHADNNMYWHEIKIHHKGEYTPKQILGAIYRLFYKHRFYPVAYKSYTKYDTFLLHACGSAIKFFVSLAFKIKMIDKKYIFFSILFNRAPYEVGQIDPEDKILKECLNRLKCLKHTSTVKNILDLSNFKESDDFKDIIIDLSNRHALETVCKILLQQEFKHINGLKLNMNMIVNISPLSLLADLNLKMIDLEQNNIQNIFLLKQLNWHFQELYISGNPLYGKHDDKNLLNLLPHLIILNGKNVSTDTDITIPHRTDKKLENNKTVIDQKIEKTENTSEILDLDKKNIYNNEEIVSDEKLMIDKPIKKILDQCTKETKPPTNFNANCGLKNFEKIIKPNDINDQFNIHLFIKIDYLHKIIVHHNNILDKKTILNKFYNMVPNSFFIPMSYRACAKQDTFYLNNSAEALDILCKNKLILLNDLKSEIITLTIKLNDKKCIDFKSDPMPIIKNWVNKSYKNNNKYIDMSSFAENKDFDNINLGLNHTKTLSDILTHITKCYSELTKIKLDNNNIEFCDGLQPLIHLKNLKILSLRHNKIKYLNDLECLTGMSNITELCLQGNPLDNNVQLTSEYINELKKIFPNLNVLDGEIITNQSLFLPTKQNYICDLEAKNFIECFVKHYFKIYDSVQRFNLKDVYHPNAIFSMSSYFGKDKLSKEKQIRCNYYSQNSRNIVRMTDFSHSDVSVFVGNNNIVELFNSFPNTDHDLLSFCIDTTMFNSDFVCLVIRGQYTDHGSFLNDIEMNLDFTRTFILKPYANNKGLFGGSTEYRIVNDQLYITPIVTRFISRSVNLKAPQDGRKNTEISQDEKFSLIAIYNKITELNIPMCKQILDESEWDFLKALNLFEVYVAEKKITPDCFQ